MSLGIICSVCPVFMAQAAEPKWLGEYSIRFLLDWNRQIIGNITGWCAQNGRYLLTGVADFVLVTLVSVLILLFIRRVVVTTVMRFHEDLAKGLQEVSTPVVQLLFLFWLSSCLKVIPFSVAVHQVLDRIFYIGFLLSFLSIFQHVVHGAVILMIDRFKRKSPENYNMNKLMLDFSLNIFRLAAGIFVMIFILQEVFHLNVTHLLASAGILGLAVAFAAKDTISNLFGAFAILGGRMFQTGDWIRAGAAEGVVERIGLRSVRIRSFDNGRIVDIPNHIIADSQIENFNRHLYWREHFSFGLTYRTTPEQMALAEKILVDIGEDLSGLMAKGHPVRFAFTLFDKSSLNLDGYVWFKPSSLMDMLSARGRFNAEVLRRFAEAGLEMAYPTTTVVLENRENHP